jgi:ABC-2 type transport system ATP-binding protein
VKPVHTPAIEIIGLTKRFDSFVAVKDVSIRIKSGEIYTLIGKNGAGKTTLLKCLVGLLAADKGTLSISGYSISLQSLEAKQQFGYVSDDPSVYEYLTGNEFLALTGRLRQMDATDIQHRMKELSALFPIRDILDKPMAEYSRGNRQKVTFLAAIISKPEVLIIDEPTVGLDPESVHIFGKALRTHAHEGGAVFFISHSLDFAKEYADRIGMMEKGHLVKEANVADIVSIEQFAEIS